MLEAVRSSVTNHDRAEMFAAVACTWVGFHIDHLRDLEVRVSEAALTLERPAA